MRKRHFASLFAAAALLCSCNANIVGQDNSKLLSALTPTYSGSIPNPWFLYDDALHTGDWMRGLDFFAGGAFAGTPVIDFSNNTSPDDGAKCWKFSIGAQTGGWYCGVILLQGTNFGDSGSRPGVDITPGHFTKCVFRARTLQGGRQIAFKAFDNATDAITVTVGTAWTTYTIPFTNHANEAAMKQFFTIVFANAAPATVTPVDLFIDDLRFEQ